jgi:lipopolysaccharide transport system ATP-binding protein
MLSLKNGGVPIIFVSHNVGSIQLLCNRAILLRVGQVIKEGRVEDVLSEYLFSKSEVKDSNNQSLLTGVECFDHHGERSSIFRSGERAFLKFNVRVNRPFKEYLLGFLVRRTTDGFVACDYNLPLSLLSDEYHANNLQMGKNAILEFEVNLLRGLYKIILHLYHIPSKRHVFWSDSVIPLTVEERISWEGLSYLNPKLYSELKFSDLRK